MRPLDYYSRIDIQKHLLAIAQNREVQVWFNEVRGRRPESVQLLGDVKDFVKQGITSFHVSEERWHDPLSLHPGMLKRDLDDLRLGWDCILDLDSKNLNYSTLTAELLIEALKFHDIKHYSIKFSGNHGFHIGVPFEAFPDEVNNIAIKDYFPDGIRVIANYLKDMIKEHLTTRILATGNLSSIAQSVGKPEKEIIANGTFDPYKVVDIDSVLISNRHLFRAPYSINEKSGMVSIPIKNLQEFTFDDAKPENVKGTLTFLDREFANKGEAKQLLVQAFDWMQRKQPQLTPTAAQQQQTKPQRNYDTPTVAIAAEHFPACITKLMSGVGEDGRKRAIFILVNFLRNMAWSFEQIETTLNEWNKKNYEPLREGYIRSQIQWFKRQNKTVLPPNCDNQSYYKTMGVYCGEGQCGRCKNPVNYTMRKLRNLQQQKAEEEKKAAKKPREKKQKPIAPKNTAAQTSSAKDPSYTPATLP